MMGMCIAASDRDFTRRKSSAHDLKQRKYNFAKFLSRQLLLVPHINIATKLQEKEYVWQIEKERERPNRRESRLEWILVWISVGMG